MGIERKKSVSFKRFLCVGLSIVLCSSCAGTITYAGNYEVHENMVIEDGFIPPENTTIVHELNTKAAPYTLIANPVNELWVGEHHRFTVAANHRKKVTIRWYSSDSKVAKINKKTGELTALSSGTVTITMHDTANKVKKRLKLTIKAEPVLPELPKEWYTLEKAQDTTYGQTTYGVCIALKPEYQYLYEQCSLLKIPEEIGGEKVLYVGKAGDSDMWQSFAMLGFTNLKMLQVSSDLLNLFGGDADDIISIFYSDKPKKMEYGYAMADMNTIIPESVEEIYTEQLSNDAPKTVRIPASVKLLRVGTPDSDKYGNIGGAQTDYAVDGNNTNYYSIFGVLFSYETKWVQSIVDTATGENVENIFRHYKESLFAYPMNRKGSTYRVPDGVQKINQYAFYGAKYIKKITLPESVTELGNSAFYAVKNKLTVTIPSTVAKFEDGHLGGPFGYEEEEEGIDYTTIITPKGSAAEQYAIEHGIRYRNE